MATTAGRTVFILGKEVDANREVIVMETGKTYELDYDTISTYLDIYADFPYDGEVAQQ